MSRLSNEGLLKMARKDNPAAAGEKLLHSIPDVVRLSGLSRSTIYNQMDSGRLAAVKFGARRMIPAAALRDWIANAPAA